MHSPSFLRPDNVRSAHWGSWLFLVWIVIIAFTFAPYILMLIMSAPSTPAEPAMTPETAPVISNFKLIMATSVLYFPVLAFIGFSWSLNLKHQARRIALSIASTLALLSAIGVIYLRIDYGRPDPVETQQAVDLPLYVLSLLSFGITLAAFALALTVAQKRKLVSVITAADTVSYPRIVGVTFISSLVILGFAGGAHLTGFSPLSVLERPETFWMFVAASLLLIPVQAATEEIVFRGFLNQAFARYVQSPIVVICLSSLLFASVHLGNPEFAQPDAKPILLFGIYFLFGIMCSCLALRDNGLEAAIGFHIGNNLVSAIVIGYAGNALGTPTLFEGTLRPIVDILIMCACFAGVWFLTNRRLPPAPY